MIKISDYSEELETALKAAREAGKIMNDFSDGRARITGRKSSKLDIVTEADERCQEKIVELISEEFPGDGFLGEEDLEQKGNGRTWVIDPIDGTSNFSRGFPYFSTSIALREGGETKVGVVLSPESGLDKTFFARKGGGAYSITEDGKKEISVSKNDSVETAITVLSMGFHKEDLRSFSRAIQDELMSRKGDIRYMVGGALDLCLVASGVFDATIDFPRIWDMAAGSLILKEAEGSIRLRDREKDNVMECVGTNKLLEDEIRNIVDDARESSGVEFRRQS